MAIKRISKEEAIKRAKAVKAGEVKQNSEKAVNAVLDYKENGFAPNYDSYANNIGNRQKSIMQDKNGLFIPDRVKTVGEWGQAAIAEQKEKQKQAQKAAQKMFMPDVDIDDMISNPYKYPQETLVKYGLAPENSGTAPGAFNSGWDEYNKNKDDFIMKYAKEAADNKFDINKLSPDEQKVFNLHYDDVENMLMSDFGRNYDVDVNDTDKAKRVYSLQTKYLELLKKYTEKTQEVEKSKVGISTGDLADPKRADANTRAKIAIYRRNQTEANKIKSEMDRVSAELEKDTNILYTTADIERLQAEQAALAELRRQKNSYETKRAIAENNGDSDKANKYQEKIDDIEDKILALEPTRDPNFWESTVVSSERDYYQQKLNIERSKQIQGLPNDVEYYENKLSSGKYNFEADSWYDKALSGVFGIVGQQAANIFDTRTMALAGSGTVIGAAAGGGLGSPITATSGLLAGIGTGMTMNAMEAEMGAAYKEMIDNGISPEKARWIALGVGGVNAALEMLQIDELVHGVRILAKSGVSDSVLKRLGRFTVNKAAEVGLETSQEVAQELTTILGNQLGGYLENGKAIYSSDEVLDRLAATAEDSALTFGLGTGIKTVGQGAAFVAGGGLKNTNKKGETVGGQSGVIKGIFNKNVGTKTNFASQEDVEQYIDYAYLYADELNEKGNLEFPKQKDGIVIGKVDDRLLEDLKPFCDIDLSNAYHVLRDNDIRHTKNSHGENTNEKYPVTSEDQKKIPDIIKNYDDVLYVQNKNRKGIYYVKRRNGVTYYLEAIRENGNILSNKQMIKVPTGVIPDMPGLKDAINKKWNIDSGPNGKNVPQMYVQDVKNSNVPINNITRGGGNVKVLQPEMADGTYVPVPHKEWLSSFGALGEHIVSSLNPDTRDTGSFQKAVSVLYEMGYSGAEFDKVYDTFKELTYGNVLSELDARRVHQAGMKDGARVRDGGVIADKTARGKVGAETIKNLTNIAKRLKVTIEFVDTLGDSNGLYKNGKIYISLDAVAESVANPYIVVASHEITHHMQTLSKKAYERFRSIAIKYEAKQAKMSEAEFINAKIKAYGDSGRALSRSEAMDEIAADFTQSVFENDKELSDFLNRVAAENKENKNALKKFIDSVKAVLKNIGGHFPHKDMVTLTETTKRFEETFNEAMDNAKAGDGIASVGNVKYLFKMDYKHQVDAALDGKLKSNLSVYVGKVSNILRKCGLPDLPMLMNQSHMRDMNHPKSDENYHWHGLSRDIIKQIPAQLKDPVMVYDSISENSKENSICVVTKLKDSNGFPIIVSIRANSQENNKYLDISLEEIKTNNSNFVTSAYGKDNFFNHINDVIEKDALLYANKNKTLKLFSDKGLQLPNRLNSLGFDNIIHESRNIVNTNSMQNGEKNSLKGKASVKGASNDDIRRQNSLAKNGEGKYNEENIKNKSLKGGERFEDTNTEGMGEGGTDKDNDSIWKRSDGSEEIYKNMGIGEKTLQRSEKSGYRYIDWSRIFGDIDVYGESEKEYAYGVLREISRLNITDTDDSGRRLSKNQQKYFAKTIAKDTNGRLITLYHATDNVFDEFKLGDFGYHIGTLPQAMDMEKRFIKEVYIKLENPVFIEFDLSYWSGDDIAFILREQGVISESEYKELSKLDGFDYNDSNSEANRAIKELLKEKRYDGIVYRNDFEARGLSFMLFDSNQIKYTSNKNPTDSSNLKRSVKGASNQEIAERFRLEREEDGIREQLKRVDGQLVDAKSVEKFSKALIAYTSSTSEKGVVMKGVSELIGLIKDGAEFSDIKNKALEIARGLIENAEALNDGEYIKYRDLSEKVSSANESNIDDLYRELSPDYPEFFDGETEVSKEQRLEKIAEVLENLEPVFDSSSNFEMATETLANKILTDIAGGKAETKSRRAKIYKAVERERELREKKVAAVRDYYLARIEGEKERRRKREALGKIRRAELTIANKLYNPDNSRHIPTKLGEVTKALLDAVQSLRDYGKGEKDYIKNVETALLRLETEYRVLFEGINEFEALNCDDVILIDGNVIFSEQYYDNVLNCIFNITQELENNEQSEAQSLDMLSSQTLESLDRCFVDLKQMINSSNKLLESRLNMGVYEAALSIVNDMRSEKKKKVVSAGEKDTDPGYFKGIESPETFFCTLGPSMEKVYKELRDRHSTEVENINALIEMCRDIGKIAGKKEDALLKLTDERAKKKIYQLESGEKIELTRMHIMSLYLLNKQTGPRGARNNIYDGGIAVEEINNKFNRKTLAQKPVKVTEKDVATLISTLSKRDIAIADRMGQYMKTFAAWGNEVSETVYGFKKYVMQNYWPRKVYKDGGEIGVLRRPRNIENISAGKTRTENSLPIVLGNAFQTFIHYGAEMAYHNAYTVQMLNFKRVLNYSQDGFSVKQEIYERHGKRAKAYIDNFSLLMNKAMKERCVELPFVGASLKMTKKALILYKLTTALKQPAAIFRAMSEMDLKHWAKLTNLLPADVEAMHKYAPISKWKEMGFYGNNIAPSIMQLATGGTFKDKFENAGMWLPSKLDDFTWRRIWQGCVSQTKAEYKNEIEYGTEEFYEKTAELFNDVIFRTQVVDSIFQKPLIMNSQNSLMREATAFQNEPLTTYNTLYRAWYDLKHKVPGAKEKAAKAVLATLLQSCWTELLVPGIMGLTTSVFFSAIGDEEEDEQGFLREYALPVVMGALSLGPVTDAISELTGQFNKGGHLSTQAFSDFVTLVGKVAEGKYTGHGATVKILSAAAHMFGVPVSGLKQHLSTIYGIGMKLSGSEHLARLAEYKYDRWLYDIKNEGNAKMFKEYMFKAYLSGDEELYKIMEKDLMEANPEEFNALKIASSMKRRQTNYLKKNPEFQPKFKTRWNLTLPLAPETEDEAVDKSDYIAGLSFEQKEQFDDAIIFGTDNFIIELQDRIEELDDETRNAVLNGMSKYVEEMALYEVTDGEYVPDGDWILQAEDIADGYGWSVGDLIYYKSKYSISTITSENCAEALEAGMDMDTYGEYRKYYNNLESIKNSAGKVVRDKPTQLREYLRSKGYSAAEAKWITDLVK